jgi:hypothetical protein
MSVQELLSDDAVLLPKEHGHLFMETEVECPFCGETFTTVVDCSEDQQTYVEDCYVCCRPIVFHVICQDGELISVNTSRE